jgi:hypothetical protein
VARITSHEAQAVLTVLGNADVATVFRSKGLPENIVEQRMAAVGRAVAKLEAIVQLASATYRNRVRSKTTS